MEVNYGLIVLATIVQFAIGAIWYTLIFGKLWGKMHNFDTLPPETQKEMAAKMGPFYIGQFVTTLLTSFVLALLISYMSDKSPYMLAILFWLGFIIPTQYADVIFGGTEGKWIAPKLAVLAGASLMCVLAAAAILSLG